MAHKTASTLMGQLLAKRQRTTAQSTEALPFVSVLCPTYNRQAFLPYLLYIYQYQDYPADRRELVILDDSPLSSQLLIDRLLKNMGNRENIRYIHQSERLTLGEKRNRLNELARGEYLICMDDDDYYAPDKISYTVREMMTKRSLISGSDQILIWYSHLNKIYITHPFGEYHAPNGTFAYHRNFLKKHRYNDDDKMAEEGGFLHDFTTPVHQLDVRRTILCISHSNNTFDKDFIMRDSTLTPYALSDIVQDTHLLAFYERLHHSPIVSRIQWDQFEKIVVVLESDKPQTEVQSELVSLGVAEEQVIFWPMEAESTYAVNETRTHLAILSHAQQAGWGNYLLLSSELSWVKQEKTAQSVNALLETLPSLPWEIVLLGGDYSQVQPLNALQGVARISLVHSASSYAVNQPYYATLEANFRQGLAQLLESGNEAVYRLDNHWNHLAMRSKWLGVYPSMAYREQSYNAESGQMEDSTYRYFRKIKQN